MIEIEELDGSNCSSQADSFDTNINLNLSSSSSESEHAEVNSKRKKIYWGIDRIFENEKEVGPELNKNWKKIKTLNTKDGVKVHFKCKGNSKCPAQMHLHYLSTDQRVLLMRNHDELMRSSFSARKSTSDE